MTSFKFFNDYHKNNNNTNSIRTNIYYIIIHVIVIIIMIIILNNNKKCHNNAFTCINIDILSLHVKYCLKIEQECIIRFTNSRQSQEF